MTKVIDAKAATRYAREDYLAPLGPAFTPTEVAELRTGLEELMKLLEPGESTKEIREWHEASRFLYDICMHPAILDHVEDLIGPDFYLWASNFFIKSPHTTETVAWHQDAYYWPLDPVESLTVWLAIDDVDESNGAMVVIPGTHDRGFIEHRRLDGKDGSVLGLGIDPDSLDDERAVSINLKAGCFSIHDDTLVHGSPANPSDRRRAGLTIRYSPTRVKNDLSVNPHFRSYLCRGTDSYRHNQPGAVPTSRFGRLHRDHSSKDERGTETERVKRS